LAHCSYGVLPVEMAAFHPSLLFAISVDRFLFAAVAISSYNFCIGP
jgi:hypothetical protein